MDGLRRLAKRTSEKVQLLSNIFMVFRSGPRNVNATWALVWDEGWREMSRRIFISPLVVPAWWKIVAALIVCNRNFLEHESWIMVKTKMMYIFPFITASLKTETKIRINAIVEGREEVSWHFILWFFVRKRILDSPWAFRYPLSNFHAEHNSPHEWHPLAFHSLPIVI